ncbi:glutathione S-transferase N-terminal domain-containing protein [Halomonas sp. IOP_31]|uniref:glutathione S-transferase N-terminal domain-containing protein n=1 Tax=Halomonas sp. IOP_31 TaxID=2876584 RepID=UPI001E5082D9|nr:glutathione S-transferase N-terminal domain-containing protein [Halomonas sp. IOP_31]MCD6008168.1 glutathione S-transferase N-terminal domain-containing protein [Halomonas sp. IOP_31]
MELFLNATSPYARMVRIVVLEKGLAEMVTLRWCDPWTDDAALLDANPAGRIPALIIQDGTALSESFIIAFYLDGLGRSEPIIPTARLNEVLHLAGLGQGLMDGAFTTVISRKHLGSEVDDSVLGQRRWRAMQRILDRLETELDESRVAPAMTLGEISVAVALDYLGFRLPEANWASSRPRLEAWHRRVIAGQSFQETAFK